MGRAAALDWFTVERIDETTFAPAEDGHWEHVNRYRLDADWLRNGIPNRLEVSERT